MAVINLPRHISVHCSATSDSGNTIGAKEIRQWHLDKGWSDIGYHFVVRRDGTIEEGRPISKQPAAVRGHNPGMLAVCWVGLREPTAVQSEALISLVANLVKKYKISIHNVKGHRDYPQVAKDCPNIPGNILRLAVANKIGKTIQQRPMTSIAENIAAQNPRPSSKPSFFERFFLALGNIFKRNS